MTGYRDHNYPAFNTAARYFRELGYRVFNPAENFGGDATRERAEYMRKDLAAETLCGAIVALPGYESSEGAVAELIQALFIPDMEIYRLEGSTRKPTIFKLDRAYYDS